VTQTPQAIGSKYPYTATMTDNSGEDVLFWVSGHNQAHICNTDPVINVTVDEKRLTPRAFIFKVTKKVSP